jgi:microcin C transport system permease protein
MVKKIFKKELSPITKRRLHNFRSNKRGFISFWIFLALLLITLPAEFISNDKPLILKYNDKLYFPVFVDYPESEFGGFLAETDYRDPFIKEEIESNGWIIWPPFRYSYRTINRDPELHAPSPPSLENPLGTDNQARDVLARLIYGFRISVLFSLLFTIISSIIAIALGAMQGFFGGVFDIIFQRFMEIWNAMPIFFLLIILASVLTLGFWGLLILLTLFGWAGLANLVRMEFLRARNFDYVRAAHALGVGNATIMRKHMFPNAMVATVTTLPFTISTGVMMLTMLDYLGFGLPVGSASLGELLSQGRANLQAPWLGITGFFTITILLILVVFIGEAVRDAFDPRKV